MKIFSKHIIGLMAMLITGCGYDKFDNPASGKIILPEPNLTLRELSMTATDRATQITKEIICDGVVVSSDRHANFFRSIVINDFGGSMELMIGMYNSDAVYPPGTRIVVKLKGLWLSRKDAVTCVGAKPSANSNYPSHLGNRLIAEQYLFPADRTTQYVAQSVKLDKLSESLCGRLISVSDLHSLDKYPTTFGPAEDENYLYTAYRTLSDISGATIEIATSAYADFAKDIIPPDSFAVTGILYQRQASAQSKRYYIKMRTRNDLGEPDIP